MGFFYHNAPCKPETLNQCCFNDGPPSATLAQHYTSIVYDIHDTDLSSWIYLEYKLHEHRLSIDSVINDKLTFILIYCCGRIRQYYLFSNTPFKTER